MFTTMSPQVAQTSIEMSITEHISELNINNNVSLTKILIKCGFNDEETWFVEAPTPMKTGSIKSDFVFFKDFSQQIKEELEIELQDLKRQRQEKLQKKMYKEKLQQQLDDEEWEKIKLTLPKESKLGKEKRKRQEMKNWLKRKKNYEKINKRKERLDKIKQQKTLQQKTKKNQLKKQEKQRIMSLIQHDVKPKEIEKLSIYSEIDKQILNEDISTEIVDLMSDENDEDLEEKKQEIFNIFNEEKQEETKEIEEYNKKVFSEIEHEIEDTKFTKHIKKQKNTINTTSMIQKKFIKDNQQKLIKNIICKKLTTCKYGEQCIFAHTISEFKQPNVCKYGMRCKKIYFNNNKYKNVNETICLYVHPNETRNNYTQRYFEHKDKNSLNMFINQKQTKPIKVVNSIKIKIILPKPKPSAWLKPLFVAKPKPSAWETPLFYTKPKAIIVDKSLIVETSVETSVEESKTDPKPVNKYKTKMCKSVLNHVVCKFGDNCHFAHSESELIQNSVQNLVEESKYKTRMCMSVLNHGVCKFGDSCHFAHSESELVKNSTQNLVQQSKHKTKMCNSIINNMVCKFGDNCNFAHSFDELSVKPYTQTKQAKNYKTRMCNSIINNVVCKFGNNCHFAHCYSELSN